MQNVQSILCVHPPFPPNSCGTLCTQCQFSMKNIRPGKQAPTSVLQVRADKTCLIWRVKTQCIAVRCFTANDPWHKMEKKDEKICQRISISNVEEFSLNTHFGNSSATHSLTATIKQSVFWQRKTWSTSTKEVIDIVNASSLSHSFRLITHTKRQHMGMSLGRLPYKLHSNEQLQYRGNQLTFTRLPTNIPVTSHSLMLYKKTKSFMVPDERRALFSPYFYWQTSLKNNPFQNGHFHF